MIIGCVKEIKRHEYRVGLTPDSVRAYVDHGHRVLVEVGAGIDAGFEDDEYRAAGATLYQDPAAIYAEAEMIQKVKEPQESEYPLMRPGQIIFTYLHLAADRKLTEAMLERRVKGVAYETIEPGDGSLPLLRPMSEIAGRMSIQVGARFLERP